MEPLSIIVISAATGGFAGKFVERIWDSGEKWLQTFFKDHKENAQIKAKENSMDFLNELAKKIKILEESQQISSEKINSAQDHPDFSTLLHKAIITAAQTENKDKHILLARLVSERLKAEPESIFSLASKIGCDAISYATVNQLMFLGLASNIYGIRPDPCPPVGLLVDQYQEFMDAWITRHLNHYRTVEIKRVDLIHLESLSCLKTLTFISRDIDKLYTVGDYIFKFENLKDNQLRDHLLKLWKDQGLQIIDLTTVGQIIGVSVSDLLTNTTTSFKNWE